MEIACGSAKSSVAEAANVLHGIPRGRVKAICFRRQMLLGPAGAALVTVVRTQGALAGNTLIASEASALARFSVTKTFVGALHPWMGVVGVDHIPNPSIVRRAGALRAISASPFRLAIKTSETLAIVVHLASAMI